MKLFDRLALAWSLLIGGLLFAMFRTHGFDDPYITYRYAANIAKGFGFVYNPSLHVLSTTTPLYALLLALPAWLGLDLPLVSNAIGCASMAAGSLALWHVGRGLARPLVGGVALLIYPTMQLIVGTIGAETSICIALILWGCVGWLDGRYRRAALLFGLATLVRADGLVAMGTAVLYTFIDRLSAPDTVPPSTVHRLSPIADRLSSASFWRSLPWGALMLYCGVLLPWLIFAGLYFGSLLPATLVAKQLQGDLAVSSGFLGRLALLAGDYWAAAQFRPLIGCAIVGLGYALVRHDGWWLPLSWNLLYSVGYTVLGVSSYFWYYAPLAVGVAILAGLGVEASWHGLRRLFGSRPAAVMAGLLIIALVGLQGRALLVSQTIRDQRLVVYREVGEWLRAQTPTTATVGALEVGIIGYYSERPMIDFAGLIQPDVARQFSPTTSFADGARYAIERYLPSYVALPEGLLAVEETARTLGGRCTRAADFGAGRLAAVTVIYSCEW